MEKIKEKLDRRYKVLLGLSIVFIGFSLFIFSLKSVSAISFPGGQVDSLWFQKNVGVMDMTKSADGNFIYVVGKKVMGGGSVTHIIKIAEDSGNKIWEDIGEWSDGISTTYSSVTSWSDRVFTAEESVLQEWVVNSDESLNKGWKIASGVVVREIASDENNLYIMGNKLGNNDMILQSRSKINGALNWETSFESGEGGRYEIKADLTGVYIVYGVGVSNAKQWKVGKYAKNNGANLWTTDARKGGAFDMDTNSSHLYVTAGEDGAGLYSFSLASGSFEWDQKGYVGHIGIIDDKFVYITDRNRYYKFDAINATVLGKIDTSLWNHWIDWLDSSPNIGISALESGSLIFYLGGIDDGILDKIKVGFGDFTFSVTPLRDAVNPGWFRDYFMNVQPINGFNNQVQLVVGQMDIIPPPPISEVNRQWWKKPDIFLNVNTVFVTPPSDDIFSKVIDTHDNGTEASARGKTFRLPYQGLPSVFPPPDQIKYVDFYINQRPIAKNKAIGNTNVNVSQSVKIRDNGSVDPDTLAPGNALTAVIADFDNDATLDFDGNLVGIDKCFIVTDPGGGICNALWPGSASSNPADPDGWSFQYNIAGAYSIRYLVFDDLIADAQAVNWTERFKSSGMAAPIAVTVGPAPSQAPTAVIEIQNENGMPIDQALPGQVMYGYVGGSNDSDGTIKKVSFCVDTTPENNPNQYDCEGSWINPYFDWDTPDFEKGWLAVAKELRGQLYQPGIHAVYAIVIDDTGMVSKVAMDKITIVNPSSPPTADDQSVTTNEDTPVDVTLSGNQGSDNITTLDTGGGHSLALKSDGTVWAWGENSVGQLGDKTGGPGLNKAVPVKVKYNSDSNLNNIVAISSGGLYSLALKSDGTVWAWGDNNSGQLGNDSLQDTNYAIQVLGLTDVIAIKAGEDHSLALKSDGTVWAWGANEGRLGDGTEDIRKIPVQVKGPGGVGVLTDIIAIDSGRFHSLALKSDGTVWAWGVGVQGQLGNDDLATKLVPVQVKGLGGVGFLTGIVAINGLRTSSLALKSDGTVWAWGDNIMGQLGDGTINQRNTPVQTNNLTDVVSIGGGGVHSLALKSDGTVWAWGNNEHGQLGDGTKDIRNIPVQVSNLFNILSVGRGYGVHSLALKSDGTVWAWGDNSEGQLGDGKFGSFGNDEIFPVRTLFPSDLIYILTSLPANGDLKTSVGTPITSVPYTLPDNIVKYTPKLDFVSPPTDPFQFKVNDGVLDSMPAIVTTTVIAINDTPQTNAGPAHSITVNSSHIHSGAWAMDVDTNPEHDLDSYQWSFTSCPGGDCGVALKDVSGTSEVIPAGSTLYSILGPTYTPLLAGDYVLQLAVKDSAGATVASSVTETAAVNPGPNQAPVAEASVELKPGAGICLDGTKRCSYNNPIAVSQGDTIKIKSFDANVDVNGDTKASDDPNGWNDPLNGVSGSGKCEWNTNLINVDGFELTKNNPSSPDTGAGKCGDNNEVTITFDQATWPVGMRNIALLNITDNQGLQGASSIRVIVNTPGNNYPTVEAGDNVSINAGNNLNLNTRVLTASISDPDGDDVNYNWSCEKDQLASPDIFLNGVNGILTSPYDSAVLNPSGMVQFVPENTNYTCALNADDGKGGIIQDSMVITVNFVPPTPTLRIAAPAVTNLRVNQTLQFEAWYDPDDGGPAEEFKITRCTGAGDPNPDDNPGIVGDETCQAAVIWNSSSISIPPGNNVVSVVQGLVTSLFRGSATVSAVYDAINSNPNVTIKVIGYKRDER